MTRRPRGLPMVVAAFALSLVFGCEARIDTGVSSGFRPEEQPDLELSVVDHANRAVAGAVVAIYRQTGSGPLFVEAFLTNDQGKATVGKPEQGDYLVYAGKEGYVGNIVFAFVTLESAGAPILRIMPLENLADYQFSDLKAANGGEARTGDSEDVDDSSISFAPGALEGDSRIAIATLTGQQIPVAPLGQLPVQVIHVNVIKSTGRATRPARIAAQRATLHLGLPFPASEGTSIAVYGFDPLTLQWTQVATGVVENGKVKVEIPDVTGYFAFGTFIIRSTSAQIQVSDVKRTRTLGPSDPSPIPFVIVPRLVFPEGSPTYQPTRFWIRGVLENTIGMKFDEPATLQLFRDANGTQLLKVFDRTDRYTIRVRVILSRDYLGDVLFEDYEANGIWHNSGFGSAG